MVSKSKITFGLINSVSQQGSHVAEFVPENEATEKFLGELGLLGDGEEKSDQNFKCLVQKCTADDLKDIFRVHNGSTLTENEVIDVDEVITENKAPHANGNDFDQEAILADELKKLGLGSDESIDIEDIDEMEDDFVMKGFMDDIEDEDCLNNYIQVKKGRHPSDKKLLYKYEDLSSDNDRKYSSVLSPQIPNTNCSCVSASSVARSEGLTNLDNHFESVLREYVDRGDDDDDFGFSSQIESQMDALADVKSHHQAIPLDNRHFQKLCNEFVHKEKISIRQTVERDDPELRKINERIFYNYQLQEVYTDSDSGGEPNSSYNDSSDSDDELTSFECDGRVPKKPHVTIDDDLSKDKLSCVSYRPRVLRLHPRKKVVLSKLSGFPSEIEQRSAIASCISAVDLDVESYISQLNSTYSNAIKRNKKESKHEKKIRKNIVKQHKQLRRITKKSNNIAFKKEKEKIQSDQSRNNLASLGKSLL